MHVDSANLENRGLTAVSTTGGGDNVALFKDADTRPVIDYRRDIVLARERDYGKQRV